MSATQVVEIDKKGWLSDMFAGASKAIAFGRSADAGRSTAASAASVATKRRRAQPDLRGKSIEVHRLAGEGVSHPEIARRTTLSHDTVALLLHLAPQGPAESAGGGTFFRILQTRLPG